MAATTHDIVQKLWSLCHVLRDDGITYHQYVAELTFLLFLKMAEETDAEGQIPEGWRWADLKAKDGKAQLDYYRLLLIHLGSEAGGRVEAIYANANTALRQPRNLAELVDSIDALDWFSAREEGDLYEGLLEKNANEKKSGAGQYFTPRPLIDAMVEPIPVAPEEEQALVWDRLTATLERLEVLGRERDELDFHLARLDQPSLAKAFRGEFVPQDTNDEPASILLERIHAEREAAAPKKKRRARQPRTPKPPPEPQPDLPGLSDG